MIVKFDDDKKIVQLSLRATELLQILQEKEMTDPE